MKKISQFLLGSLSVQALTYESARQNWPVDRANPIHEPATSTPTPTPTPTPIPIPIPMIHLCDYGNYIGASQSQILGHGNDHGGSTVYDAILYNKRNPHGKRIALKRIREIDDPNKLDFEIRAMKDFHLLQAPRMNLPQANGK